MPKLFTSVFLFSLPFLRMTYKFNLVCDAFTKIALYKLFIFLFLPVNGQVLFFSKITIQNIFQLTKLSAL